MLGGLAPLHAERLAARGGPSGAVHDQHTFFDTSSYGPRAIDAMLRVAGVDRLLYGSDRPVVAPQSLAPLGAAAERAIAVVNHERLAPARVSWRMGSYEVLPGGELRRHALSYAEELRPLDGADLLRPFGG